jgi:hypothetical protein
VLRHLCRTRGPVRCADLAANMEGNRTGRCSAPDSCKPSICAEYALLYRSIHETRKRLEALNIGTIVGPENKMAVRDQGWQLTTAAGVELELDEAHQSPGRRRAQATWLRVDRRVGRMGDESARRAVTIGSVMFSLIHAMVLALRVRWAAPWAAADAVTAGTFLLACAVLCSPQVAGSRRGLVGSIVWATAALIGAGYVATVRLPDEVVLTLSIKLVAGYLLLLVAAVRRIEVSENLDRFRPQVADALTWSIWFYLASIVLFPAVSPGDLVAGGPVQRSALFMAGYDHGAASALLVLALFFIAVRRPLVSVTSAGVMCNHRPLFDHASAINDLILRELILRYQPQHPGGALLCAEAVRLIYPSDAALCDQICKPSLCPLYQKLYKRMREVRKALETRHLGTVIAPAPGETAQTQGWRVVFFDDVVVRVVDR